MSGTYAAGQVPVPKSCSDSPLDPQLDCNTNLHMNTYTVGLGNVGTIYGVTHNEAADAYATPPQWHSLKKNTYSLKDFILCKCLSPCSAIKQ